MLAAILAMVVQLAERAWDATRLFALQRVLGSDG
jgi:hypothetical protein